MGDQSLYVGKGLGEILLEIDDSIKLSSEIRSAYNLVTATEKDIEVALAMEGVFPATLADVLSKRMVGV